MCVVVPLAPGALAFEPLEGQPFAPFVPECREWLDTHCGANISSTDFYAGRSGWAVVGYQDVDYVPEFITFLFIDKDTALLFKLMWGGLR